MVEGYGLSNADNDDNLLPIITIATGIVIVCAPDHRTILVVSSSHSAGHHGGTRDTHIGVRYVDTYIGDTYIVGHARNCYRISTECARSSRIFTKSPQNHHKIGHVDHRTLTVFILNVLSGHV